MIAIGSDHGGFDLKKDIIDYLKENNFEFKDYGTHTNESCDFAPYVKKVTDSVQKNESDFGIIICGTGIGVSIAANRNKGIRAALCSDSYTAEMTRLHNDANILALGSRVVGKGLALKITETFLNTSFSNEERHVRRMNEMEEINAKQ